MYVQLVRNDDTYIVIEAISGRRVWIQKKAKIEGIITKEREKKKMLSLKQELCKLWRIVSETSVEQMNRGIRNLLSGDAPPSGLKYWPECRMNFSTFGY